MLITCGPTGSTGQQIADEINRLGNMALAQISTLTVALAGQALTTTPSKLTIGNTTHSFKPGITVADYDKFTCTVAGVYELSFNITASYDNNEVFTIDGMKNGVSITGGRGMSSVGDGVTPHVFNWSFVVDMSIGDYLEFFGKCTVGTGTLVVHMSTVYLSQIR
jgi:hypothetical protein